MPMLMPTDPFRPFDRVAAEGSVRPRPAAMPMDARRSDHEFADILGAGPAMTLNSSLPNGEHVEYFFFPT